MLLYSVGSVRGSPENFKSLAPDMHGVGAGLQPVIFMRCRRSTTYFPWCRCKPFFVLVT